MTFKRRNILPFSRDDRRAKRFDMGLPPKQRPPRRRLPIFGSLISILFLVGVAPPIIDALKGLIWPANGCRIWQIVDGDTVKVHCPATGRDRARLISYDSPELFSPSCTSEWMQAIAATYYLRWQFWKAREISVVASGQDRYDRRLVNVFFDRQDVATRMIAAGLARPYEGGLRGSWC